jgi:trehalose synthase
VGLTHVDVGPLPPDRFRSVLTAAGVEELERTVEGGRALLEGRVVWNVNSTPRGGGVAELLRSLLAYTRGGGVDARWVVIEGSPDFFHITKRLHNHLHGSPGDGGPLGEREDALYRETGRANADELAALVRPGDVVLLHDPQTAALAEPLKASGAHVLWRCHVGLDMPNELARAAWRFLLPYVEPAEVYVFSREAFAWESLERSRIFIVPPSIDAFSPKNQELPPDAVAAILQAAGFHDGPVEGEPVFQCQDGSPGRVDRRAPVVEDAPLRPGTPVLLQVSRWDRLKDPLGVIDGYAEHVAPRSDAHLVLAGPDVLAVADDPEGPEVLREAIERREALPAETRARVHLARLPMDDPDENAAIVHALQRHASVIAQKSLAEGFGLTVAEGMWKARPVVATRVGGIQDQIVDGESGLLVDPLDLEAFGTAVSGLLADPGRAELMGRAAQERVREGFLGVRHLAQYVALLARVIAAEPASAHEAL